MGSATDILEEERQGEVLVMDLPTEGGKKIFLESYGCQMNFSDSEVVAVAELVEAPWLRWLSLSKPPKPSKSGGCGG